MTSQFLFLTSKIVLKVPKNLYIFNLLDCLSEYYATNELRFSELAFFLFKISLTFYYESENYTDFMGLKLSRVPIIVKMNIKGIKDAKFWETMLKHCMLYLSSNYSFFEKELKNERRTGIENLILAQGLSEYEQRIVKKCYHNINGVEQLNDIGIKLTSINEVSRNMVFAKLKIEEIFEIFDRLVGKGIKNSNRDLYMYVVDNIEKEYSWFYSNRRKLLSSQKIQKKTQNSKIEIILQASTYLEI